MIPLRIRASENSPGTLAMSVFPRETDPSVSGPAGCSPHSQDTAYLKGATHTLPPAKSGRTGFLEPPRYQDTKIRLVVVWVRSVVGDMIQGLSKYAILKEWSTKVGVWCCMMLYDVVWCCRELAEMILRQLDSQGFWPFPGLTLVPL